MISISTIIVLNRVEEELSKNAETYPALKGQFAGLRKYRVGDYRVIHAILGDEVLVLRIGHRKDVYKKEIWSPKRDAAKSRRAP